MAARLDSLSDDEREVTRPGRRRLRVPRPRRRLWVTLGRSVGDARRAVAQAAPPARRGRRSRRPAAPVPAHRDPRCRLRPSAQETLVAPREVRRGVDRCRRPGPVRRDPRLAPRGGHRNLAELGPLDAHGIEPACGPPDRLNAAGRRAFGRGTCPRRRTCCAGRARCCRSFSGRPNVFRTWARLLQRHRRVRRGRHRARRGDRRSRAHRRPAFAGRSEYCTPSLLARPGGRVKGWADEVLRETERGRPVFEAAGDHAQLARTWRLLGYVWP